MSKPKKYVSLPDQPFYRYDDSFKRKALSDIQQGLISERKAAKLYSFDRNSIANWKKRLDPGGQAPPKVRTRGRSQSDSAVVAGTLALSQEIYTFDLKSEIKTHRMNKAKDVFNQIMKRTGKIIIIQKIVYYSTEKVWACFWTNGMQTLSMEIPASSANVLLLHNTFQHVRKEDRLWDVYTFDAAKDQSI